MSPESAIAARSFSRKTTCIFSTRAATTASTTRWVLVHLTQWRGGSHLQRVGAKCAVRVRGRQFQRVGSENSSTERARIFGNLGRIRSRGRPGALYKFHIESQRHGYRVDKADPMGMMHEKPPRTASVIWDLGDTDGTIRSG